MEHGVSKQKKNKQTQQTCMTYTIAVCTVKKLLMTDRWTVRNM